MKKQFLFFTLILLSFLSYSIDVPKTQGFVSDYENIFTPDQTENLKNILSEYETATSIEIAILTISDYGDDIFNFAQETATQWGIGKEGVDNGLLVIISKNNNEFRVQTGYGLEGYLPDAYLKNIGDSITSSYFKNEQYYEGTLIFINSCKSRIEKEGGYTEETNKELIKENKPNEFLLLLKSVPLWVWILLGGIWLIIFFKNPKFALDILLIVFYILASGGKDKGKGFGGGKFGGGGSGSKW